MYRALQIHLNSTVQRFQAFVKKFVMRRCFQNNAMSSFNLSTDNIHSVKISFP